MHMKAEGSNRYRYRLFTMFSDPLLLVDCVVILLTAQWIKWLRLSRVEPLPPGPPGYLLIGNTLDMLGPEIWETARKWGEAYGMRIMSRKFNVLMNHGVGGIIYLKSFGKAIVVLNSYDIAVDLFEGRPLN